MQKSGPFDPRSLANPHWFGSSQHDSLYIEAYELALVPAVVPRKIFRFDDIVILIKTVKLDYLELAGIKIKFGEMRRVELSADQRISTSDLSPKLLTIQPHASRRYDHQDELAERSSEYVSLLISTNYRNIAFRRLFTQIMGSRDGSLSAAGEHIRLPFDLPAPDLTSAALDRFTKGHGKLHSLPPEQKQKIALSLHWHLKGIQSDGLDSFLSLWIAMETLAMKSTKIADLNDALASAYQTTRAAAASEFGVGKIFGLRSQIVHNGVRKRISTDLTDYMECLYADLVVQELLGESLGRARELLRSKNIDIGKLTA